MKFKEFLCKEERGIYEPITPQQFEKFNKSLLRQGGKIVQSVGGTVRVMADGDKTLIQTLRSLTSPS